jgi:hypothetical protein
VEPIAGLARRCVAYACALLCLACVVGAGEGRLPEPSKEAQQEAEKAVKEVYADAFAKHTPEELTAFALKFLGTGGETKDDPKTQYVLFREARELAVKAGDVAIAFAAIDQMASTFDVDALDLQYKALNSIRASARTPEANKAVAEAALAAADRAVAKDNYELAGRLAETAGAAARATGDAALAGQVQVHTQDVARIQAAFVNVALAMRALTKNPADADAKFKVGQFYCLYKDDKVMGLVYLSEGSNAAWANAAKLELAKPTETADLVKVGDAWYDLIPTETASGRDKLKQWASQCYEKALPNATGLAKMKIEKRLKDLAPPAGAVAATPAAGAAAPGAAPGPALNQQIGERTRKALPTDVELKKFEAAPQASKSGDARKTKELNHLWTSIRARLVTDPQTWNEADLLARLDGQVKINKANQETATFLGEPWLEALAEYLGTAKTMDQFAAKVLGLEKGTETYGTPTKAQVATLLKPALNRFVAKNSALLATTDAKAGFCDWLKKQGVTSAAVDEYKSSLK